MKEFEFPPSIQIPNTLLSNTCILDGVSIKRGNNRQFFLMANNRQLIILIFDGNISHVRKSYNDLRLLICLKYI
jgi:hypothetical protein